MTPTELQEYLSTGELDFEFDYAGKSGSICFCYLPKVYILYDDVETVTTWDKLMVTPFIDGKTLAECATEIEFYG